MESDPPPQQAAKQISHGFLAARGPVTEKAGRASPKTVASVCTTVSGSSMGRTPNPFSARSMGIRLIHPNPKANTRKATIGWLKPCRDIAVARQ